MTFKDVRRQRCLDEARAKERDADLIYRIEDRRAELKDENLHAAARSSFAWTIASDSLELLILHYTAGQPVSKLAAELPGVIRAFDEFIPLDNPSPNEAHALTITQIEAYVYVMWLLALCRLLGQARLEPTVLGWLDQHPEFNRGRDGLFESVVEKLTGAKVPVERVLLHPDAYRPLAKAIVAEKPEDRPELVKTFLDGWYKNMKDCYWHGTHTDGEGSSYFGYWAFEAALVTYLWDIDDTTYRDHLVYPKDLVDYAREHFPLQDGQPPRGHDDAPRRCPAGEPCPREGWWSTPAKAGSRRHFQAGEVMPEFKSDWGATIWQWDAKQG